MRLSEPGIPEIATPYQFVQPHYRLELVRTTTGQGPIKVRCSSMLQALDRGLPCLTLPPTYEVPLVGLYRGPNA